MNRPPTSTPPSCSQNHCVTIKHRIAYAFATNKRGNRFGQLGRPKSSSKLDDALKTPKQIQFQTNDVQLIAAAAGGSKDSGHTLLLDLEGQVHACGCDRWQQLGLGSSEAGAVGYTWQGRLWHYTPQLVSALSSKHVVAVAAGDDHSVVLLKSGEVYTFGRGEHGQLGQAGKPFVMPPTKSMELSSNNVQQVASIRAEGNCTGIFSANGGLLKNVGRCPKDLLTKWRILTSSGQASG